MRTARVTAEALAELQTLLASLSEADARLVQAIFDAPDQVTVAALIRAYYGDRDRADRTPRGLLYLHLGMLGGIAESLLVKFVH